MSSRNQTLVLEYLKGAGRPVSAYGILDGLREDGIRAPLQVYRALQSLTERGEVHKIESLNAFVACERGECTHDDICIFMLCSSCKTTSEMTDKEISSAISRICSTTHFESQKRVVEISGTCTECVELPACDGMQAAVSLEANSA